MNGGGEANFESASKYPLAQLQVPADELPEGVDINMREVRDLCFRGWGVGVMGEVTVGGRYGVGVNELVKHNKNIH